MSISSLYSEQELIHRFRTGDEAAFTKIYDSLYYSIYQYARRWLNDPVDAEDVTAETFIKLLQHRAKLENLSNIEGFLKVTVRNACFNALKYRKVRLDKQDELVYQLSAEQEPDFGWVEAEEEFLTIVYKEVEKLPVKMKEIFLLSFRDGLKPPEIAAVLGLKVGTVNNQKTNAVRILRDALQQHPHLLIFLYLLNV